MEGSLIDSLYSIQNEQVSNVRAAEHLLAKLVGEERGEGICGDAPAPRETVSRIVQNVHGDTAQLSKLLGALHEVVGSFCPPPAPVCDKPPNRWP